MKNELKNKLKDIISDYGMLKYVYINQKDLGWGDLTTEKVEIHEVPGDHLSMVHKPHVKKLAKRLKACLDNIQTQ